MLQSCGCSKSVTDCPLRVFGNGALTVGDVWASERRVTGLVTTATAQRAISWSALLTTYCCTAPMKALRSARKCNTLPKKQHGLLNNKAENTTVMKLLTYKINLTSVMFVPCIAWLCMTDRHYALIIIPLFITQAPTCFGTYVSSSGSVLYPC
jgi:hypothetical protein